MPAVVVGGAKFLAAAAPVAEPAPSQDGRPSRASPRFLHNGFNHIVTDEVCKDILVVCDAPSKEANQRGFPCHPDQMELFAKLAENYGITPDDYTFIGLCPPVPESAVKSASRKWEHVNTYVPGVRAYIEQHKPKALVTFGELASRALFGRAVKITKIRGVVHQPDVTLPPILPMLSPGFVRRFPEHEPTFNADVYSLARLKAAGYNPADLMTVTRNYEWRFDLSDILAAPPAALAVDTETTGLRWWEEGTRVLTVQICPRPGVSYLMPIHPEYVRRWQSYWPDFTEEKRVQLVAQVRTLLENPNILKINHNIKFDHSALRKEDINVQNWKHDTQLMAFGVDENMMSKTLDDCVRIFVPDMSGYSDCVAPEARLLTDDLRWVRADSLKAGDQLLGFDEHPVSNGRRGVRRRMRSSEVVSIRTLQRQGYRMVMRSGRTMDVSGSHGFLTKRGSNGGGLVWRTTHELQLTDIIATFPFVPERDESFDAGWMSGFLDGEGYATDGGGIGIRVGWSQNEGPALERSREIAIRIIGEAPANCSTAGKTTNLVYAGWNGLELLQAVRPARLLSKRIWEGKGLPTPRNGEDEIVGKAPLGEIEVLSITTTTHTFIAEGLCSRNSVSPVPNVTI